MPRHSSGRRSPSTRPRATAASSDSRPSSRLKPGATNESLARELNQLLPRIGELYPEVGPGMPTSGFLKDTHASIYVNPMRDDVVGTFGNVVWIAVAAGVCLLLISFANVASLLLTRAEGRQRELAVRVALGAGPRRIISQYLPNRSSSRRSAARSDCCSRSSA